ncbi:MAG: phosphoglycerate mutase family protein [Planctomycetota bacterium]
MEVILVRHGEAESAGSCGDADRSLTARGAREATALGQLLSRGLTSTACVVTSPVKRARQTAEAIARELGSPPFVASDELRPGASDRVSSPGASAGERLLALLARHERGSRLVVVAHAPDVSEMLAHVLNGGASPWTPGFPPGASAWLRFAGHPPRPGGARLVCFLAPEAASWLG